MTLYEQAAEFHKDNPRVYRELRYLAMEAVVTHGRRRLGIGQLWERLRWEYEITTTETRPKLNNNYRAFYARLLMQSEPVLRDVFATRKASGAVGIPDGMETTFDDDGQARMQVAA